MATLLDQDSTQGVTLLELVVAMVVSLLVMGGVYKIYHANAMTSRTQEGLARLQESGRLALDLLSHDIRMAGYFGCASILPTVQNNLNSTTSFLYDFATPIQGNEWNGTEWLPARDVSIASARKGSDILTVRTVHGEPASLRMQMPDTSAVLMITPQSPPAFKEEDIVMISDCRGATIFQVTDMQTVSGLATLVHNTGGTFTPGNSQKELDHAYGIGAELMKVDTVTYYVRTFEGVPTLYRKTLDTNQAIVPGVESMQLLYGVGDLFLRANEVTDWSGVTSVRIGLLLHTVEEIGGGEVDTSTYQVLDALIDPVDDRRLRRIMTTTVAVRNRLK
jgi:type IV pilus assembly protein PilW